MLRHWSSKGKVRCGNVYVKDCMCVCVCVCVCVFTSTCIQGMSYTRVVLSIRIYICLVFHQLMYYILCHYHLFLQSIPSICVCLYVCMCVCISFFFLYTYINRTMK